MTRTLQPGPSPARPAQPPPVRGSFGTSLGSAGSFLGLDDEGLDDPNLRRIDAFLADDTALDEPSDEI